MIIKKYKSSSFLPTEVTDLVNHQIHKAFEFDDEQTFKVNDTKFFKRKNGELNRCVINSAEYISKKFQYGLEDQGWEIEKRLCKQTFDAFRTIKVLITQSNSISESGLKSLFQEIDLSDEKSISLVQTLYHGFFKRRCFIAPSHLAGFFECHSAEQCTRFKFGCEFETGNIASSFRAISKLNVLYLSGEIDVGIFVTSLSSAVSQRIWPASNRNGSLTELESRRFMEAIEFPFIIYGFEPDAWCNEIGFLGKNGQRFTLNGSTRPFSENGKNYLEYVDTGYIKLLD